MTGTLINVLTVIVGSLIGLALGNRLPDRVRSTILAGLALFTIAYGLRTFIQTENALIVLGAIMAGGLLGEWWDVEARLRSLGAWLEARVARSGPSRGGGAERFIRGFVTASLVFCIGPMTILGSIQDGLGDPSTLIIKATLDGFASIAFAAASGLGVLFSALVILVYQGGLSLLAGQAQAVLSDSMIREMSATGGLLIMGVGIGPLLELKPIRLGNFLPALLIAPLIGAIAERLSAFGIP
jgi:hypothetical protein